MVTAARRSIFGLVPVVLIGIMVAFFLRGGLPGVLKPKVPPIEELAVERVLFRQGRIDISLINDGPDPVQIAQVIVNGSYWNFDVEPRGPVARLGRVTVGMDYPWIEGEPQFINLVTSTGATFMVEVEVAAESPTVDGPYLGSLALMGFYIGVIPVFVGLLWLPFLRVVREGWYAFFLAVTVGLLVFLAVDTLVEAFEAIGRTPGSLQGTGILLGSVAFAYFGLEAAGRRKDSGAAGTERSRWYLAFSVAFGIGVHNLGEGLAVGSAIAIGNISLGALLVVGFMLHNVTEGLAIVAPVAKHGPRIGRLVLLGLLAGAPAIAGAWIGGFAYSPILALLFLGIGLGAILQVTVAISRFMMAGSGAAGSGAAGLTIREISGLLVGIGIMYGTSLLVTA